MVVNLQPSLLDDFLQRSQWALNQPEPGFRALRTQKTIIGSGTIAEEESAYIALGNRELLNIGRVRGPGMSQVAQMVEPIVSGFYRARQKVL